MRQFRKNSRKALAAFFAVWLSGIAFLFCCPMSSTASAGEFCPLAKAGSSHCDRSKNVKNSQVVSDDGIQGINTCALIAAVFDKTRKIERELQTVQPAAVPAPLAQTFAPIAQGFRTGYLYPSFSPVQNKIFLKHRVFRI